MLDFQTKQVTISSIPPPDIVICASGYEERSSYAIGKLKSELKKSIKICFTFSSLETPGINETDEIYAKLGFSLLSGGGDDDLFIDAALKNAHNEFLGKSELNILVDYSSMTRLWYASILRFFYYNRQQNKKVNLFFIYSFSVYSRPSNLVARNIHVSPIDGFSTFAVPDKPTALIIGLGYEAERANGLSEYFDAETFLFYNDTTKGKEYSKDIEERNDHLLKSVPAQNIFRYPISNLDFSERLLFDLSRSLSEKYRVVIAPCGPKPFTLISLLVSLRLPGVDVWRISAGKSAQPVSRKPSGDFSVYKVSF